MTNKNRIFKVIFNLFGEKYLRYVRTGVESEIESLLKENYPELQSLEYKEASLEQGIAEYERLILKNIYEIEGRTNELIKKKRANLDYIGWIEQIRNDPNHLLSLYKVSYCENDLERSVKVVASNSDEAIQIACGCSQEDINAFTTIMDINLLLHRNNEYLGKLEGYIQKNLNNLPILMKRKYEFINLKQVIDNTADSSKKIFRLTPK
jgi:hypothetical protein